MSAQQEADSQMGRIVVDEDPDELTEVICQPFEAQFPGYAGERYLAIHFRGREEAFAVLTREQSAALAALLIGGDE